MDNFAEANPDSEHRGNRGIGVDATLASPGKKIYEVAIGSGTTDVTGIDLDAPGASFTKVVKNPTAFIDLAANTLDALGNLVPEKWEGLTIGQKLADGLLGLDAALRRRR